MPQCSTHSSLLFQFDHILYSVDLFFYHDKLLGRSFCSFRRSFCFSLIKGKVLKKRMSNTFQRKQDRARFNKGFKKLCAKSDMQGQNYRTRYGSSIISFQRTITQLSCNKKESSMQKKTDEFDFLACALNMTAPEDSQRKLFTSEGIIMEINILYPEVKGH